MSGRHPQLPLRANLTISIDSSVDQPHPSCLPISPNTRSHHAAGATGAQHAHGVVVHLADANTPHLAAADARRTASGAITRQQSVTVDHVVLAKYAVAQLAEAQTATPSATSDSEWGVLRFDKKSDKSVASAYTPSRQDAPDSTSAPRSIWRNAQGQIMSHTKRRYSALA